MTHRIAPHLSRRLALLAAALVTLCLALAVSAPQASASPYCGGRTLSNYEYCYGAARSLSGVTGYGVSHSVCVGADIYWGGCSGGPGQSRTMNLGFTINGQPWIEDNAAGATVVYGETF